MIIESKEKDEKRGIKIFKDYGETHILAINDEIILDKAKEVKRIKQEIQDISKTI
jgi:hypothetical protein